MGFGWTDIVPWVISTASATLSGFTLRRAVRSERREVERRTRDLPAKFGLWLEWTGEVFPTNLRFMYLNRGTDPVRNITITVKFHSRSDETPVPDSSLFVPLLSPAEQPQQAGHAMIDLISDLTLKNEVAEPGRVLKTVYIAEVAFTDSAGEHWSRDLNGKLERVQRPSQSELEELRCADIAAQADREKTEKRIWESIGDARASHTEGELPDLIIAEHASGKTDS